MRWRSFCPASGFLGRPLCRLSAAVLMVLTAFGGCRRLLRQVVIFFCSPAPSAEACWPSDCWGRGAEPGGGVLYSSMDLKIVLLSAAGCYAVITLIFRGAGRHTAASRELLPARLSLRERQVELTALVDTGNTLTDPVSGRPVMVAEGRPFPPVPAGDRARAGGPAGPGGGWPGWGGPLGGRLRLLPYRAVGVDRGLLLAVRVDRARVGGEELGPLLVAMSPTPVSDGGSYRALIGALT